MAAGVASAAVRPEDRAGDFVGGVDFGWAASGPVSA